MKAVKAIAVNLAYIALLVDALHFHNPLSINLLKFVVWFNFCVYSFASVASGSKDYFEEKPDRAHPPSLPRWASRAVSLGSTLALAAYGWFFYAVLSAVSRIMLDIYFDRCEAFLNGEVIPPRRGSR